MSASTLTFLRTSAFTFFLSHDRTTRTTAYRLIVHSRRGDWPEMDLDASSR